MIEHNSHSSRTTSIQKCKTKIKVAPMVASRVFKINQSNIGLKLASNYIKTNKYNKWNFLPLCLLNQFRRLANCYFLLIAVI